MVEQRMFLLSEYIFPLLFHIWKIRDSSVGIATGYGLDDRGVGVRVPEGSRIFSMSFRPFLESTKLPIQWVRGALSLGVKRPGREAEHSTPASAEVKKIWIYTSTPPYALVKHRDNLTLPFIYGK
jgi:hypothetical protein